MKFVKEGAMQELEVIEQYLLVATHLDTPRLTKPTFVVNAGIILSWMDYCTTE